MAAPSHASPSKINHRQKPKKIYMRADRIAYENTERTKRLESQERSGEWNFENKNFGLGLGLLGLGTDAVGVVGTTPLAGVLLNVFS